MAQDTIIKGCDNPIVFEFTFSGYFAASGLNTFSSITLDIGSESYDNTVDTTKLIIDSDTQLTLSIGDSTTLADGSYSPTIKGFSVVYDDGYQLTSECKNTLGRKVRVC